MSLPPCLPTGSLVRLQSQCFIHSYPSESPIKEPSQESGKNFCSPSSEPHVDRRLTYNGVQPGSPTGSFTHCYHCPVPCSLQHDTLHVYTLLSLPSAMQPSARYLTCLPTAITTQCHAAFSTIPSMFTHCYYCPVPCSLQHDTFHVYTLLSLPSAMQPSA
jgi:hypothetical protein